MGSVHKRFPIPSIHSKLHRCKDQQDDFRFQWEKWFYNFNEVDIATEKAFPAITCVEGAARGVQTAWSGQERPWKEMERMGSLFIRQAMGYSAGGLFWQWNLVRIVCSILYILALVFFWLLKLRRTLKEISFSFYFIKFLCWAQNMKSPKCLYCISNGFPGVNFALEGLFRFFFMIKQVIIKKTCYPAIKTELKCCCTVKVLYEDVFSPSLSCSWDSGNIVLNQFTPRPGCAK